MQLRWLVPLALILAFLLLGVFCFHKSQAIPTKENKVSQWALRQVAGLALESNGVFKESKTSFDSLKDVAEKSEVYQYAVRGLEIQVIRILYKEDIALSLEDSVQGAVDGFAQTPDVHNLTHKETTCTVSGKPAMRVSIAADRARAGIRLEGVTILDGQILYQVQALFEARDLHASQDAKKILDSVRISP
jgi:hypothetical protein